MRIKIKGTIQNLIESNLVNPKSEVIEIELDADKNAINEISKNENLDWDFVGEKKEEKKVVVNKGLNFNNYNDLAKFVISHWLYLKKNGKLRDTAEIDYTADFNQMDVVLLSLIIESKYNNTNYNEIRDDILEKFEDHEYELSECDIISKVGSVLFR